MPLGHRPLLAMRALLLLSAFLGPASASGQGSALESIDGGEGTLKLQSGATDIVQVTENTTHICTLTITRPEHPEAPFIGKHPMRITALGVEVGVDGATPHVGLRSKIVLNPIHNYDTAPTYTLRINGPNGYRFESAVVMPGKHLDGCERTPRGTDACTCPHARARYQRTELITPAWPQAGMYAIQIVPSETDPLHRRWRGHTRHFEVMEHPLAQHLALPPGYAESSRHVEDVRVTSGGSTIYDGSSLLLCGQKRRAKICIQATHPLPNCQAQLDAGAAPGQSLHMESQAHSELETDLQASRWCSQDRLITVHTNRRFGMAQPIGQLQEQISPDLPAQASANDVP